MRRGASLGGFLGGQLGKDFASRANDNCAVLCGLRLPLGGLGTDLVRQSKMKNGVYV
jgi:hypothetical protein